MNFFDKYIKEYWFIITFVGMVIVSWTTFAQRLNQLESKIQALELTANSLETIKIDIAVIKEKVLTLEKK